MSIPAQWDLDHHSHHPVHSLPSPPVPSIPRNLPSPHLCLQPVLQAAALDERSHQIGDLAQQPQPLAWPAQLIELRLRSLEPLSRNRVEAVDLARDRAEVRYNSNQHARKIAAAIAYYTSRPKD